MPVALERKLKHQVAGKKMSKERKDAYVYGTLRKTGWKPKRERAKELSAKLDSIIQFAGGYINTNEGVKKERGVGAHFNRATGRYVGGALLFPVGALPGWGVDALRAKHNIQKTKYESEGPPWLAKGPKLMSSKTKPIEFGILSALDDIMARAGSGKMKYRHDLLGLQGKLTKNPKFRTTQRPGVSDRSVNSNLVDQMAWNESKRHGIQSTYNMPGRRGLSENPNFSTISKPIQFGAEILGPWHGNTGHESKIDQLEFPAGPSPLAVMQMPFPQLMAFLNQRNILQQVF